LIDAGDGFFGGAFVRGDSGTVQNVPDGAQSLQNRPAAGAGTGVIEAQQL
jgi:hypothetical protein